MAHQIAVAARRQSFAPRCLVLLDPLPPIAGRTPDLQPVLLRTIMTSLAATMLAAAEVQGRTDAVDETRRSVYDELRSCSSDAEAATRVMQLLVAQGIVEDKVQSTIHFVRQAQVMNQGTLLVRQHLAVNSLPPAKPPWQTLLVLASEREQFFVNSPALGVTAETAGAETARLYGSIKRELQLREDAFHLRA